MKHLLKLQLWHLSKYAELIKVVRQNDKLFINLYINLMKTIQKMPCTCTQRMNQLLKGMKLL